MYSTIIALHIVLGIASFVLAPVFLVMTRGNNKFAVVKKAFSTSIFSTVSLGGLIVVMGGSFTRTCATLLAYSAVMFGILHFGSQRSKKLADSK